MNIKNYVLLTILAGASSLYAMEPIEQAPVFIEPPAIEVHEVTQDKIPKESPSLKYLCAQRLLQDAGIIQKSTGFLSSFKHYFSSSSVAPLITLAQQVRTLPREVGDYITTMLLDPRPELFSAVLPEPLLILNAQIKSKKISNNGRKIIFARVSQNNDKYSKDKVTLYDTESDSFQDILPQNTIQGFIFDDHNTVYLSTLFLDFMIPKASFGAQILRYDITSNSVTPILKIAPVQHAPKIQRLSPNQVYALIERPDESDAQYQILNLVARTLLSLDPQVNRAGNYLIKSLINNDNLITSEQNDVGQKTMTVYDVRTARALFTLPSTNQTAQCFADNTFLITESPQALYFWDLATKTIAKKYHFNFKIPCTIALVYSHANSTYRLITRPTAQNNLIFYDWHDTQTICSRAYAEPQDAEFSAQVIYEKQKDPTLAQEYQITHPGSGKRYHMENYLCSPTQEYFLFTGYKKPDNLVERAIVDKLMETFSFPQYIAYTHRALTNGSSLSSLLALLAAKRQKDAGEVVDPTLQNVITTGNQKVQDAFAVLCPAPAAEEPERKEIIMFGKYPAIKRKFDKNQESGCVIS